MTIKFNNVYLKECSTVAGKLEKEGTYGKLYDKVYDDYYIGEKTFEQAEIKMIKDSTDIVLKKSNLKIEDKDVVIASDLLNQITPSSYSSVSFNKPFMGVYNACASLSEEFLIAANLLNSDNVKNVLTNISCHNMTAERQYRNPTEYGCPRPKRATFTVTGCGSAILTKEKTGIKITSASIGTTVDLGVTDVFDMGSVMAPAAARTIYEHLKDTNSKTTDFDLIITGDLGVYGKEILKEYMKEEYNIALGNNLIDAGSLIYDRNHQNVQAGGSGPACIALVTFSDIIKKMKEKRIKKILLVATGALMSPTMFNQKLSIPSISHAVCLEVV